MTSQAWNKGREQKLEEIAGMGFNAARDKFNMDYPVGNTQFGSTAAWDYAKGELSALQDKIPR